MAKIHENFGASKTWQWTFLRQYNDGLELSKLLTDIKILWRIKLPLLHIHGRRMDLWLVHWTLSQEFCVQDLAKSKCCALRQKSLPSECLSPPSSINGYWKIVRETWWNVGGRGGGITLWWTSIQGGAVVPPVASCYRYQDQFWLAGSFCLSRDFAFTFSTVRIKSLIKKTW